MGLRSHLVNTLFGGNKDPLSRILKRSGTAVSPDTVVTAPIGTFIVMDYYGNAADNDIYINTDGSTAWSLVYDASSRGYI